ncbi:MULTISPECIES: NADAR family protein [unclassified Moraxella]|uniref:NADAR family protein n=1 Tax=unclassified Moraxella TaxID=2685852 RepID=UPI003AF8DC39
MQIYDIDWVVSQFRAKNKLKYLYFWGHTPRADGQVSNACFSQWYDSPFVVDDVRYPTAEHYMMAQKALLFGDKAMFEAIISPKNRHPKKAKELGRKVANFDEKVWNAQRFDIVVNGNVAKFSQHEDLKTFLLNTGNRVLVEASPFDKIWGVGLAKDDEKIANPLNWNGLNLLGFALMVVRDKLNS